MPRISRIAESRRPRPAGFTLVELLVVISIIGILVALLLPAVQAARATARKAQCQNQLKQIGLACLNFESVKNHLPPGVEGKGFYNDDDTPGGSKEEVGMAWGIAILPFMEEQATYDQFDFSGDKSYRSTVVNASGVSNAEAGGQWMSAYVCPEDQENVEPFAAHGVDWAPSTYRASAGTVDLAVTTDPIWWDRLKSNGNYAVRARQFRSLRGAIVAAGGRMDTDGTKIGQITDGTSKTALVGEYHPGPGATSRNVWASGWRYHSKGHFVREDYGKSQLYRTATFAECIASLREIPPGLGGMPPLCARSFTPGHAGGIIQFVFCDGSIHAIRDVIDDEVYLQLGSAASEEVVSGAL